jgi:predicted ATP-grasp superfamily ATP-dependent carboligase
MALARYKDEIVKYAKFPFENYHKLLLLHDKKYFFELIAGHHEAHLLPQSRSIGDRTPPITEIMAKAGIEPLPYHPMENFPTVEHFINSEPGVNYPLIVKTRRSTSAVGVHRVANKSELRRACDKLGGVDIIVQENLTGRGVGISSIRWDKPEMIHHFGHKRVREYPISGGASTSREPWDCDDHPLTRSLTEILNRLDWHGVVMFEFKEIVTSQGQESYRFLEANPRFWGSVPLAMANGVNFPVLLCRAALGMELPEVVNRKNIRARILFSDTLSLVLNVLKKRRVRYHLHDYFDFKNLYLDDFDRSDWPGTIRVFRRMIAEFFLRLFGRK